MQTFSTTGRWKEAQLLAHPLPALFSQPVSAPLCVLRLQVLLLREPATALRKLKFFQDRLTFSIDPFSLLWSLCLFIFSGSKSDAQPVRSLL